MKKQRIVQFWARIHILNERDLVTRECFFDFLKDEDAFAEMVDSHLSEWIKDLKRFGLKEYGWKYVSS